MMKLNFILPFFPLKPGGGCKIMYEYANRFGEKGYDVQIYHVTTLPYMKYKYPHWLRYLRNNILYILNQRGLLLILRLKLQIFPF